MNFNRVLLKLQFHSQRGFFSYSFTSVVVPTQETQTRDLCIVRSMNKIQFQDCIMLSSSTTTIRDKVSLFIIVVSHGDYCISMRRQASIHLRTVHCFMN